jgi:hypothetical protein
MNLASYSAFNHMCDALFVRSDDLMLIVAPDPFTLYCDASRTKDTQYTVVAGAIASVENWKQFDAEWRQALADNHLHHFRMSEFAHSVGQFKNGWKGHEAKRRALLERLVGIIAKYVKCWIGACVSQKTYDAADRVYLLREYLHPYPLCAVACVEMAHYWRDRRFGYLSIEYVFEDGDDHQDQLRERISRDFGKEPIFRKKRQATAKLEELVTPLQVADFAAYEIGKAYGILNPDFGKPFERFRQSLFLLSRVGDRRWGELTELGIRTMLNVKGVSKRPT